MRESERERRVCARARRRDNLARERDGPRTAGEENREGGRGESRDARWRGGSLEP